MNNLTEQVARVIAQEIQNNMERSCTSSQPADVDELYYRTESGEMKPILYQYTLHAQAAMNVIADNLLDELHNKFGICGHCGKKKCAGKASNSRLSPNKHIDFIIKYTEKLRNPDE